MLVSDVVLPGPSGRATAATLRLRHPALKTLFMSGYYDVDVHGPEGDAEALLQKPFAPRDLAHAVARVLASEPASEAAGAAANDEAPGGA